MKTTPTTNLVSLREAAEYTSTCTRTIRRRIADGTLTGYRVGPRLVRVDLNELESLLLRPIPAGLVSPADRFNAGRGSNAT